MRHNRKFNHLSRTASHRHAMLANMAVSLIMHKRITTTVAKAKALKKYVEPLITRSKDDTTNSRRVVFSYLQNKFAVTELFQNISVKVANRPGGYTRIIKTGLRQKEVKKATRTRRSRKKATVAAAPAAETQAEETPAVEAPATEAKPAEETKAE